MNQILSHLDADQHFGRGCVFWNSHDDWFLSRDQIKIKHHVGSLRLVDITAALKPGQTCEEFTFNWWPHNQSPVGIRCLLQRHGYNLRTVFNELHALPWTHRRHWQNGDPLNDWQEFKLPDLVTHFPKDDFGWDLNPSATFDLYRTATPSIRVWSPFYAVKPLTARPAKWTVAHVVRALLAGQFTDLQCNGVYTDDYAHDAAVNFRIGKFTKPEQAVAFARRILESPSGWWAYTRPEDPNRVSICCHHFDSNSFTFDLMKRFNPAAAAGGAITSNTPTINPQPSTPASVTVEPGRGTTTTKPAVKTSTGAGCTLSFNAEKGGIELHFSSKPGDDIRDELKGAGFRWSRFSACWYVKDTPEKRAWTQAFLARQSGSSTAVQTPPPAPAVMPAPVPTHPVIQTSNNPLPVSTTPSVPCLPPARTTGLPTWRQRFIR